MGCCGTERPAAAVTALESEEQLLRIERIGSSMDLVENIEQYVHEAELLSHTIEKCNFMISRLEGDQEMQKFYTEQLTPTLDEYRQLVKALKFLFEEYFAWEKKNFKTRNLRYRRLYKLVIKDSVKSVQRV